jgi:quinol monooxygenase YgiN
MFPLSTRACVRGGRRVRYDASRVREPDGHACEEPMIVVHVRVHVRPESVDAFRSATTANATASRNEPGVARFDVLQQTDDPARFALVEVYRTAEAVVAHKETPHYKRWRDAVEPMMAEPRSSTRFASVFPADADW